MRVLILSIYLLSITSVVSAASLSRADKQGFFDGFRPACTSNMQKTSSMTPEQVWKWCGCIGLEYVEMITKEELKTGQIITPKINAATNTCQKKLLTPSGLFK